MMFYIECKLMKECRKKKNARQAERQMHIFKAENVLTGARSTLFRPLLFSHERMMRKNYFFDPLEDFFDFFNCAVDF